jgi:RNA polymerase sigma-70 factor (ECF subfamily)
MNCLTNAWDKHEAELRGWLRKQTGNAHDAEDLLQDVFLKALRQDAKFCQIATPRAWLFEVARNALTDRFRLKKQQVELPDDLAAEYEDTPAVETLSACLPRALSELSDEDRDVLTQCDLQGITQDDYARQKSITLAAAKSRVQRARKRLRQHLTTACQVRFDEAGKVCCFVPRSTPK